MQHLADLIRNIPDFPKPGIQFKDITTLLLAPDALREVVDHLRDRYAAMDIEAIVGIDARGFIFGACLSYALGIPFVAARKKGKLPGDTLQEEFELEYGTDCIEIHVGAITPGQRCIIIDDLLATGGTTEAVVKLVNRMGGTVVEATFIVELPPLGGRKRLNVPVYSLIEFMVD